MDLAPDHRQRPTMPDGVGVAVFRWQPAAAGPARGVVHIAHGMAEHALRYGRVARALNAAGYVVYAHDHRGHGATASEPAASEPAGAQLGFFADREGWARVVDDMHQVNRLIAEQQPGLPIALLAHSLGSMLAQDYLFSHGGTLAAAVLSGTQGGKGKLALAGRALAEVERRRVGPRSSSAVLHAAAFGAYNRSFKPTRTDSDWLSSDPAEVDKYIADPLCGFRLTTSGWCDVFDGIRRIEDAENQARVPAQLPIYLFAGALDPVGDQTRGVRWLIERYRVAGVRDVSHRFYEGGRHEMLNEVVRDQVTSDLLSFLDRVMPPAAG